MLKVKGTIQYTPHQDTAQNIFQIIKTFGSLSIMSDRCQIDIDPRVFVMLLFNEVVGEMQNEDDILAWHYWPWMQRPHLAGGPLYRGISLRKDLRGLPLSILRKHYSDVIMNEMASHIAGVSMVCSTVYSGADQRKHQTSASLAFVRRIHRWPVNSPHRGPVTRKMFPFDDVFMWCMFAENLLTV